MIAQSNLFVNDCIFKTTYKIYKYNANTIVTKEKSY